MALRHHRFARDVVIVGVDAVVVFRPHCVCVGVDESFDENSGGGNPLACWRSRVLSATPKFAFTGKPTLRTFYNNARIQSHAHTQSCSFSFAFTFTHTNLKTGSATEASLASSQRERERESREDKH